ncbi:hypothetical protein ACFXAZ_34905 [Streptomyces sp. NPDC059477]
MAARTAVGSNPQNTRKRRSAVRFIYLLGMATPLIVIAALLVR